MFLSLFATACARLPGSAAVSSLGSSYDAVRGVHSAGMGQSPSQAAGDPSEAAGNPASSFPSILSGCVAVCSDTSESTGSLAKVVQQCCIASEREGVLELVEQHRVIGDAVSVVEEEAWVAWTSPRVLDIAGGLRQKLLSRPQTDQRFIQHYSLGDQVGEGSFGNVYKAHARGVNGADRAYAVKVFSLASPIASPQAKVESEEAKRKLASFLGEYAMLARLDHPHIIRMFECFQSASELHLLLEMCAGGELYALLVKKIKEEGGSGLPEGNVQIFFRQMLWAVGYLHGRRIVHRDIKPENFLVCLEGSEEAVLKLCDFGTAMVLTEQKPRSLVNIGTLSYTAPEVYMRKGADLPADTWSLGVVLYVMLTGTNPFRVGKDSTKQETVKKIKAGAFATQRPGWLKVSEAGRDLVTKLLVLSEQTRLTCAQALRHGWVLSAQRSSLRESEPASLAVAAVPLLRRMLQLQKPQRYALLMCALSATEADLPQPAAWRTLFLMLDEDNDGLLSIEECAAGLRRLSNISRSEVPDEDLTEAVKAADIDQSGFVDWAEWLSVALLSLPKLSEAAIATFAHRHLQRLWSDTGQNEVVVAIWKLARQLRLEKDKEASLGPLSASDLQLVLSSCQDSAG
ncbi:unnamed protein product [Effrenium voratum]|uniref:Calcium-dependent protein kinase n=1 Tax=Effrenium voratum TaxID=2562239 RepID=A0AA36MS36_9DINO|nr:unnamed protein product [Effrenium voratum]